MACGHAFKYVCLLPHLPALVVCRSRERSPHGELPEILSSKLKKGELPLFSQWTDKANGDFWGSSSRHYVWPLVIAASALTFKRFFKEFAHVELYPERGSKV